MSNNVVGRPMEILLVEDNLADACLTREALQAGHVRHRLTHFTDGEEALLFIRREKWFARAPLPDLILLDLNLPKLDGRELLALVREDPELASLPVVVMTASQDHEDKIRAQDMAVQGYLRKPIDMEHFLEIVRDLRAYWHEDVILPSQCLLNATNPLVNPLE